MEAIIPEFVRHADHRVEPFEPERITGSLFRVAERIGVADAFLARELTESITHFLETEATGGIVTTAEIAETVVRVVRELGHPALARAYEERSSRPEPTESKALVPPGERLARRHAAGRLADIDFSLKNIYPRELVAAHEDGLITIEGLGAPMELAGIVAEDKTSFLSRIRHAGDHLADDRLDSPGFDLDDPIAAARRYAGTLADLARAGDVTVAGHLRIPGGDLASSQPEGLFPGDPRPAPEALREWHRELASQGDGLVRWRWHLSAGSVEEQLPWFGPEPEHWSNGEFVFDHPKRPAWLGPGLSRESKASLVRVGINLDRLFEMLGPWPADTVTLLNKAGALARFAKTAGHVKQDWLRRHGDERLRKAFLLDRAPVVLVPRGLAALSHRLGLLSTDIPRQLLAAIRTAVETDRPRQIPSLVDSDDEHTSALASLTAGASRNDWKAAGLLCQAIQAGRVDCRFDGSREEGIELLKLAARSGVTRLRLFR